MPKVDGPLRRSTTDRMGGGVAGGLAARFGIDANLIRVVFALLSLGGGTGFALYMVAWLVIPVEGSDESIFRRVLSDRRTLALATGVGTLLLVAMLVLAAIGLRFAAAVAWPVAVGAAALVLVWRGADDDERAFLRELVEQAPILGAPENRAHTRRGTVARVLVGAVVVVAGLGGLAFRHADFASDRAIVGANLVIVGFLVIFGPWWLRLARELAVERRERVRTEERANVAATVHDSVLQTLALIQRSAGEPREVIRLARAQERELRAWLFEGRPPGSFDESKVSTMAEAVSMIAGEVEAAHGLTVDAVVVGDCALTDDLRALLAAGREATVNAAKWSGAPTASLFVEVEPATVSIFVRDRGAGFDPDLVDADRRGLAESIKARMARHGGVATVRSAPGQGTEVELVMPRDGHRP